MKKLLLLLPAFLLLLTACNAQEKTAAETYLENHSEQEIVAYFEQLTFTYESFNDPKELSNEALLNFLTAGPNLAGPLDLEQWLDEESFAYLVPVAEIYGVFDKYFGEYNFDPNDCEYYPFDAEKNILTISAVGGGSATSYDLIKAEAIDAENIKITLLPYCDEESKYKDPWWYEVCTAKIVDGEPQFTSYQTPVYPNQTEQ